MNLRGRVLEHSKNLKHSTVPVKRIWNNSGPYYMTMINYTKTTVSDTVIEFRNVTAFTRDLQNNSLNPNTANPLKHSGEFKSKGQENF